MTTSLFEKATELPVSAEALYRWHARPGAFARLAPPWQRLEICGDPVALIEGSRVHLRLGTPPFRLSWLAEHREVDPPRGFVDVQVQGPFARWEHRHQFESLGPNRSLLRDRIRYRVPLGALGGLVAGGRIRRQLERTFAYRHLTTRGDLELHERFRDRRPLRVAMSATDGLIGSALAAILTTGGHTVVPLIGGPDGPADSSPGGTSDLAGLEGLDAVVDLGEIRRALGRPAGGRSARPERAAADAARQLESLFRLDAPPRTWVLAATRSVPAAAGSSRGSPPASSGALARSQRHQEAVAAAARRLGARVIRPSFGAVLSPRGGLLSRLAGLLSLGLGPSRAVEPLPIEWVSVDDAAGLVLEALMSEGIDGAVAVSAPQPSSLGELSRELERSLRRRVRIRLSAWATRRLLRGVLADRGRNIAAGREPSRRAPFELRDPTLARALARLFGRPVAE